MFSLYLNPPKTKTVYVGERQSIAQKGVRAIDARNSAPRNVSNATKTSVRAPGLSTKREHDTLGLADYGKP